MCTATTLHEQQEIWNEKVRPVILSWWVSWGILRNERFLWKAMGVPKNQRDLILTDYYERSGGTGGSGNAIWEYVVNTFDPIINSSLLSNDNYFYLLCLTGKYTKTSHPSYLSPGNYKKLTAPGAFSGVRIHTDELNEVLARLKPGTLTVAVVMDSMDWFDPKGTDAREQIRRLNMSMKVGGRVMLRSAGLKPWYVDVFEEEGFVAKRVGTRNPGSCIDRYVQLLRSFFGLLLTLPVVGLICMLLPGSAQNEERRQWKGKGRGAWMGCCCKISILADQ